jgi:hypothetical protein
MSSIQTLMILKMKMKKAVTTKKNRNEYREKKRFL